MFFCGFHTSTLYHIRTHMHQSTHSHCDGVRCRAKSSSTTSKLHSQRTTKIQLERTPINRSLKHLPDLFWSHIKTLQVDHVPFHFVPRKRPRNVETLIITCRHDRDTNTCSKWARDDSSLVEHFRMKYQVQMLSIGSKVDLVVRHRLSIEHQRNEPEGAGFATTRTAVMLNMHTLISPSRC